MKKCAPVIVNLSVVLETLFVILSKCYLLMSHFAKHVMAKSLKGCFSVFTDSSCQTSLCCCPHKEYYFHSGSVIIISFLSFLHRLNRINKQHQFHTSSFIYFLFMKRVTYKLVLIITSYTPGKL